MDSMYDRLGDLLNEALSSGGIPKKETEKDGETLKKQPGGRTVQGNKQRVVRGNGSGESQTVLPPVPSDIAGALFFLGIGPDATPDECRTAYRKKLKRYHPDNNSVNPVVQKVASAKTEELVTAYRLASAWLGKKKSGR